jgi:uncharacterized membrane protein
VPDTARPVAVVGVATTWCGAARLPCRPHCPGRPGGGRLGSVANGRVSTFPVGPRGHLSRMDDNRSSGRPSAAGLVLGVGAGGFVDGIVAHQLLEWHHMLSSWYPPTDHHHLRINMVADGLLHLACLVTVAVGVALLNRSAPLPWHMLVGWALAGWGWFNLVEGVVDHLVLGVHHVRTGPAQWAWDLGFLAWGAILVLGGTALARSTDHRRSRPAARR